MNKIQNMDFSLLTQVEIDTLVDFLEEKKETVNSSVLSQESIDKLIQMIRYNDTKKRRGNILLAAEYNQNLEKLVTVRNSPTELCEIQSCLDEEGFIRFHIINCETQEKMELLPSTIEENDVKNWGKCIIPQIFCNIAQVLKVRYSMETYTFICSRCAEIMFGDVNAKIPFSYLPDNEEILKALITNSK